MKYRAEIDGLRAVAILPVVLFHAGIPGFGGGFIGVDVFLVISGYLITSIILADERAGSFTFGNFYMRRMRRIFPALFLMLAVTYPIAFLVLSPSAMQEFSGSVLASTLFYSNVFFMEHSGYFAAAAELRPLLHTWSLAVEEQFYLLFPALLLVTSRMKHGVRILLLLAAVILSLASAQVMVANQSEAAFFMLAPRLWELGIGALAAFWLTAKPDIGVPEWTAELLNLAGLVLILGAVFMFGPSTPFPGFAALLPTLGTLLIVLFASERTLLGRLLSWPAAVLVGRISYSLYLWHYPLMAFARHIWPSAGPLLMSAIAIASIVVAWLSWRFVEQPIRHAKVSTQKVFALSGISALVLAAFGILGSATLGFQSIYVAYRLDDETRANYQRYASQAVISDEQADNGNCIFHAGAIDASFRQRFADCVKQYGPGTVLIGDSHGARVFNAIASANDSMFFVSLAKDGCRPYGKDKDCTYDDFITFAHQNTGSILTVMLQLSGSHMMLDFLGREDSDSIFVEGNRSSIDETSLAAIVNYIDRLPPQLPVIWLGPYAEPRLNLQEPRNYHPDRLKFNALSLSLFQALDGRLKQLAATQTRYRYVSLVDALDFGATSLTSGDCLTFYDDDHFTPCGAKLFGPQIIAKALVLSSKQ